MSRYCKHGADPRNCSECPSQRTALEPSATTPCSSLLDSAKTAIGLEKLHRSIAKATGDQWSEIVDEQRPLIEGLMLKMGTDNPLSAACEVIKSIPPHDESRQLIVAVAVEMTLSRKNIPDQPR